MRQRATGNFQSSRATATSIITAPSNSLRRRRKSRTIATQSGLQERSQGRFTEAIADLQKSVKLDPRIWMDGCFWGGLCI